MEMNKQVIGVLALAAAVLAGIIWISPKATLIANEASGGGYVLLVGAAVRGRNAHKNIVVDQILEPCRENVLGQAKVPLELAEPAQPIEGIADDQQRPPVANGVERPRDGTGRFDVAG